MGRRMGTVHRAEDVASRHPEHLGGFPRRVSSSGAQDDPCRTSNPENVMPQTRKETEPLTERIGVRVTAGEKARLREDAALASLSVSELVRRRYFGRPILARADQAMVRELRRLGGLLKSIRAESGGTQPQQTEEALRAVVAAIERLGDDRQKD